MESESPKHWYAIRVRLFHELKLRDNLQKMGIECFVPTRREIRVWHDRRVIKDRVLSPQLIFVRTTEQERIEVLGLSSVLFCMCVPGKSVPARIPDKQMEDFIFFVKNADANQVTFSEEPIKEGDKVRIIEGALTGLEGVVAYVKGKHYFAIKVDMLGCALMEIENHMIEKITDL